MKGQKFKLDPKLLIGAIAGVAIILIGLGSLVLYMLMSSKGKAKPNESEVANTENDKQNAKKGKVDDKKQTATKLDTPEKTETPKTEEKTPEAATNEEFNPADLKKNKPAETTLDPEKAVAVVETPKIEPPVTEPKEEPVTPPPDETPLPTPPPVDPPKPAPPMPAADPFKDLPEYFKLPDVAAEKPETIGLVNLAGKVCIVELAGGANASKGKQAFELKNANNGTDPTKWEITLTGKPGEPETVVAGMRIHENQLQFGWTSSGRASPVAPYLMNCVMRLSVGSFTKRITFRQPSITPPLKIDLDKPTPLKFAFDTAPDAKNLRLEIIVTPENGFGSPDRIESSHEIGKSTTLVWLGDNESNRYAGLRFESKASAKGMDVNVTTWVRFDTSQKDSNIVFIKKKFATQAVIAENLVAAANQSMDARMAQADKLPEEQKRGAKALLETDLKALSDARDRFKIIENYMKTLDKNATLHARIVYDTVDLGKVVLAQTEGAPELKKPEVKK